MNNFQEKCKRTSSQSLLQTWKYFHKKIVFLERKSFILMVLGEWPAHQISDAISAIYVVQLKRSNVLVVSVCSIYSEAAILISQICTTTS